MKRKRMGTFETTLCDYCWTRFWRWITGPWDRYHWKPRLVAFCKKKGVLRVASGTYVGTYGISQSSKQILLELRQLDKKLKEEMKRLQRPPL